MNNIESMLPLIYLERLKAIKKRLGHKCVHLANRKSVDGDRSIDVTLMIEGKKEKFTFGLPFRIQDIKNADYEYLEELIMSKLS
jgi:hypothetical protein